jgi:hypothetical protein
MITTKNYFEEIKKIKFSSLPKKLQDGYDFTKELTEDHTTWKYYRSDEGLKRTVDDYLEALNEHLNKNAPAKSSVKAAKKSAAKNSPGDEEDEEEQAWEAAKALLTSHVKDGDSLETLRKHGIGHADKVYRAHNVNGNIIVTRLGKKIVSYTFPIKRVYDELVYVDKVGGKKSVQKKPGHRTNAPKPDRKSKPKDEKQKFHRVRISTKEAKPMERIDEEVKFIKRFVLMHGKVKTETQILAFINALQRAIVERRIRKTSSYAKEIEFIQETLVGMYRDIKEPTEIHIDEKTLEKLAGIAGSEKIRLSINYMKRFIGMQGKNIDKEKAQRLHFLIQKAIERGKIKPNDPYMSRIKNVLNSLKFFVEVAKKNETLKINQAVLNGINEALGCGCEKKKDALSGVEEPGEMEDEPQVSELPVQPGRIPPETLINSMDFVNMEFERLGFTGKWLALIGDPCPGFSAMITGRPKYGKSTLALEFAGYLAQDHGNVLYVAKEEGLDATLQQKIKEFRVQHPRLTVTGELPQDLRLYDFIFLDSVNTLNLSPDAIQRLKKANAGKSFFPVHQTTKAGTFRGDNRHLHNVDSVIELPERGRAVQYGRFNQGGEMQIFDEEP